MLKQIPNAITLVNLSMGCIGLALLSKSDLQGVAICIGVALLADFLDGFIAKLLQATSTIGKQLDSLSDVVSFGVLPGAIVYSFFPSTWLALFSLALPLAAALRLAKFNIDERQNTIFLGLPTPANAIFILGLMLFSISNSSSWLYHPLALSSIVISLAALMLLEIPLFSLKFERLQWKENEIKFIFALSSLLLLIFLQSLGLMLCIVWYVALSLVEKYRT
ncbi:MAG: CDP-diacylglycerol--serine O-phosphatidyltransferase [Saprospiraceae bacterium]|nr:CDP-diacylglycerol--serine O-phosphatidyltransferase [Saprospiraceae bacterium]